LSLPPPDAASYHRYMFLERALESTLPITPVREGVSLGRGQTSDVVGRLAKSHGLLALAKLAVTSLFIIVVLRKVAFGDLLTLFGHAQLWPLVAAIGLLLGQFPLAGWRWRMVLRSCGGDASPWLLQNLIWVGQFVNQVMPTFLVGDAIRGWYLSHHGISRHAAFVSLLLDRVVGMAGLLLLILIMSPLILTRIGGSTAWIIVSVAAIGSGGALLGLLACKLLVRWQVLSRWHRIEALAAEAGQIAGSLRRFALITSLAVGTNVAATIGAYFVALAFGIELTVVDALALIPVALFAVLMPISIAGWGVREGVLVFLLGIVGVPAAQGLVLSVAYGLAMFAAALPGGLIWLRTREQMAGEA
jgi:glycosyltransferase 2 family protein